MMSKKKYEYIQYSNTMNIPDGIYNALYNREPSVIRMVGGIPVYVSFIGFLNSDGENIGSSIFSPNGVLQSSVELLLPAQEIKL